MLYFILHQEISRRGLRIVSWHLFRNFCSFGQLLVWLYVTALKQLGHKDGVKRLYGDLTGGNVFFSFIAKLTMRDDLTGESQLPRKWKLNTV